MEVGPVERNLFFWGLPRNCVAGRLRGERHGVVRSRPALLEPPAHLDDVKNNVSVNLLVH